MIATSCRCGQSLTPLPLTFSGLLIGSLILSAYELHWIPRSEQAATGFMLLALPLPLHVVASVFGFLARSSAAATGSAVLAAVWLAIALDLVHPTSTGSGPSAAVGDDVARPPPSPSSFPR